jgi:hypothetical protein
MFFFFVKMLDAVSANTPNRFIALFATGLYMLHPALAETVNYIISRSDTLSTLFVIMAFVVYQYSAVARRFYLYLIPMLIGSAGKTHRHYVRSNAGSVSYTFRPKKRPSKPCKVRLEKDSVG